MNHRITNFIRDLRGVTLQDQSFSRIRASLSQYADMHPVITAAPTLSPYLVFFRTRSTLYAGALVLFVIVSGSGVVGGAEKAIPGDALYSVKINVNEKVAESFADTTHEKAELSAKLATRRADEALTLLAAGKLDEDTATYLEGELATHVEESNQAATALEIEGDVAGSLAVRTELGEDLAERAAAFEPATPDAVADAPAATMMMKAAIAPESESVPPADPTAFMAGALRIQADKVAEARNHTAAALLPGIGAQVDLAALNANQPAADVPQVDIAATATLMLDAATTTEEVEEVQTKQAPLPGNAWPTERSLWLNQGR
ncbi:MAG: DUF5667 domain-containing protein [Patescibacteria group bacterium]